MQILGHNYTSSIFNVPVMLVILWANKTLNKRNAKYFRGNALNKNNWVLSRDLSNFWSTGKPHFYSTHYYTRIIVSKQNLMF